MEEELNRRFLKRNMTSVGRCLRKLEEPEKSPFTCELDDSEMDTEKPIDGNMFKGKKSPFEAIKIGTLVKTAWSANLQPEELVFHPTTEGGT